MGHYTGYKGDIRLSADLPPDVRKRLEWMVNPNESNGDPVPPLVYNHSFFDTDRPYSMLLGGSSYFEYRPGGSMAESKLELLSDGTTRLLWYSSTKGDEDDLLEFLKWLRPWIVSPPTSDEPIFSHAHLIGQAIYEECTRPMCAVIVAGTIYWSREIVKPEPADPNEHIGFGYSSSGYRDGYDGRMDFTNDTAMETAGIWDSEKMLFVSMVAAGPLFV